MQLCLLFALFGCLFALPNSKSAKSAKSSKMAKPSQAMQMFQAIQKTLKVTKPKKSSSALVDTSSLPEPGAIIDGFADPSTANNIALELHNRVRSSLSLPHLVWNPQLFESAQQVAWQMILHGCPPIQDSKELGLKYSQTYGENIHVSFSSYPLTKIKSQLYMTTPDIPIHRITPETITAIEEWILEGKDYEYFGKPDCCSAREFEWYRHYMQMIWSSSKCLGCASLTSRQVPDGNKYVVDAGRQDPNLGFECRVTVCHYDPKGLKSNTTPF